MKEDERQLMQHVIAGGTPYDFAAMHVKRTCATLDKWDRKGWWEWGTNIRAGWLTDEGRVAVSALLASEVS